MDTFKTLFALLLVTVCLAAGAQAPITSIDKVYIERDTVASRKGTELVILNLQDDVITSGDVIVFDIPGFSEYLTESGESLSSVRMTIENIPIAEMPAFMEDAESGLVSFAFALNYLTSDHRQKMYNLKEDRDRFKLGISVGDKIALIYKDKARISFPRADIWRWLGFALIGVFVVSFLILIFMFPEMIRNDLRAVGPVSINGAASFSFGKTQLAFWTLIVISSFIYIWALTGNLNSMNTTALILLGISSFTVAATSLINSNEEVNAVRTSTTEGLAEGRKTDDSFFKDILSDNDGISIHRFQSFAFNILFGVAFFKTVIGDYTMPSFSETQLILLGLSNGTYAFLKRTENR